jgi:PAS domain-containing protein
LTEPGQFALTGAAFFELVHLADRERVQLTVRAALDQHTPYACDFRILRPDGEVVWVANRGRGRYAAEGEALGVIGTIADISARKQTEQAMQAALEASAAGTFHWDMRSVSLRWDAALDRLLGLKPGAAVQSLAQFITRVHPEASNSHTSMPPARWARARRSAVSRKAAWASFNACTSTVIPSQLAIRPSVSRIGVPRAWNQRYSPSCGRTRYSMS